MSARNWFALTCAAALLLGCAAIRRDARLPAGPPHVREQLAIYADFALPKHHRLIEELVALRTDVATKLQLPVVEEPIHVYLFDTSRNFRKYMATQHPGLPSRRAYFLETDTRLIVYAHWGDRVAEDLRHETTHGYLHAVAPGLPLWLDEGIAEYFELPRTQAGLHVEHLATLLAALRQEGWRPDLARLESLHHVEDMELIDYAEAWAWVHLLLDTTPERNELLKAYLAAIRREGAVLPLSDALAASGGDHADLVVRHLEMLANR